MVKCMIRDTFTVNSKYDGLPLSVLFIAPKEEAKGIVQLVHGMAERKERYEELMSFLAENGYVCVIHDHRGHGESLRSVEDRGFMGDYDGKAIVEDAVLVGEYIKNKYPDLPLILFGHSMGSLVVRCYAQTHDELLSKLIVCGSPSKNPLAGVAVGLEKTIRLFRGARHRSKLLAFLSTGKGDKQFPGEGDHAWLSRNRENVEEYLADEGCGFAFTCNGYENLFKLMKNTYQKKKYEVKNPTLPIYFIAGEKDPVIVSKKAWLDSVDFMKELGYSNTTCQLYEDMRHEIHNELGREEVYQDILAFIEGAGI